ncbi:DUF4252 domain-containing protein [Lutimonas sp.]|uniref:DUF4252 domain-containing protein n=1 Tax=Lutimonas sp. TaxID=1872403 RepID=UPI003D9BCA4A
MKNSIKKLSLLLMAALVFVSCNNQPTIQEYYVDKQENDNFIAIDLPASLLKVEDGASEETKKTMSTIKKLNILAFKVTESNTAEYKTELAQVKSILKGDQYSELMRMKHEGINIVINYQGEDDAIDEFLLLASDNDKGFALARVLGDKMQPEKIMKMAEDFNNIDKGGAGEALSQLSELFGDEGI